MTFSVIYFFPHAFAIYMYVCNSCSIPSLCELIVWHRNSHIPCRAYALVLSSSLYASTPSCAWAGWYQSWTSGWCKTSCSRSSKRCLLASQACWWPYWAFSMRCGVGDLSLVTLCGNGFLYLFTRPLTRYQLLYYVSICTLTCTCRCSRADKSLD